MQLIKKAKSREILDEVEAIKERLGKVETSLGVIFTELKTLKPVLVKTVNNVIDEQASINEVAAKIVLDETRQIYNKKKEENRKIDKLF
jgi:hypothetical protein